MELNKKDKDLLNYASRKQTNLFALFFLIILLVAIITLIIYSIIDFIKTGQIVVKDILFIIFMLYIAIDGWPKINFQKDVFSLIRKLHKQEPFDSNKEE